MAEKKDNKLQIHFFERIKEIIPPSLSLVNEVADLLEVSSDSAYRRLRGETPLTIDELSVLCTHFKIGFDLFSEQTGAVSFNFEQMHGTEGFKNYLLDIYNTLVYLGKAENAEVYYAAIDIPLFHHFNYPDLAAFKIYYWLKNILNVPYFENNKYSSQIVPDDLKILAKQIYDAYCKVPGTEIWTKATINSSIAQIEYFWDSGLIQTKEVALQLCSQLEEELKTIQLQAEKGSKDISNSNVDFKLYLSDIEIGNNCILTRKGDSKTVYLSFHSFNKLATVNSKFCEDTFKWLNNLIRKSTLISGVSEKQRYIFFKYVFDRISKLKQRIETPVE